MRDYLFGKISMFFILAEIGGSFSILFNAYLDNEIQFVVIFIVVMGDLSLGALRAYKAHRLSTPKALKSVYRLGALWALLAIVISIEEAFRYVDWLSEAMMLPILVFFLARFVKNMGRLKWIPKNLLVDMLSRIDKYKDDDTLLSRNHKDEFE